MILAMTVTQGPHACHIASWVAPSFPPLRPGTSLVLPDLPLPCAPPGPRQSRAPSAPGPAAAWMARGAGEGVSLLPTGTSSRLFCRLYCGVLIIPAPGGIVPHYYTVDLYLIRHHLKPSAPSWHPRSPRTPSISACFIPPAQTKVQFRDGIKEKLLNFHPAKPGDPGAPRHG